ncbi:MAG: amidohydrolase family protein [Pseudomonadota bacterium]|nr:amidohydrolase family protein [Pseudomonadota bacterium]
MKDSQKLIIAKKILLGFDGLGQAEIVEGQAIFVKNNKINEIGPTSVLRQKYKEIPEIGGENLFAMPGLVNAHHHLGVTPFQLGAQDHPLELWFAERLKMRNVPPTLDTLYSAFEMISSGVTTVQHLQSRAPGNLASVLDQSNKIIAAYKQIGMRASYSFALRDQNRMIYDSDENCLALLPPKHRPTLKKYFESFSLSISEQLEIFNILTEQHAKNNLIEIQLAPSNLHWLSDKALETISKVAIDTGAKIHMHLLETPYQAEYARRRTGQSALEYIQKFGLLGPQLTIGHGVWMTEDDADLLAESGGCLCHNCSSNLRLKSGKADLSSFLSKNIPIALGIDEAGINDDRDMLQEMRLAYTLHRQPGHSSLNPSAAEILRMATEHGAASTPFSGKIGRLEKGLFADILLLDLQSLAFPYQDFDIPLLDIIVRRAKRKSVDTVIIDGNVVFNKGKFTRVDKDTLLEEISKVLSRAKTPEEVELRELSEIIMPAVKNFYSGWY